ncbi:MAG: (2Fe-2S) ferredoxin domain-containing protein [Elusimicrobia bacterium]|jgi:(2Fe-2S) ferredoxin|nr:(2Fe-2S) ferredoxin domain-containing protein [Elusimicrobiota bacterium]
MEQSPPPFETLIFVCTHQRAPGERIACANAGKQGIEMMEGLRKTIKEKGLEEKIRICKSGCLDRCEVGPNILIYKSKTEGQWIKNATVKEIPDILNLAQ